MQKHELLPAGRGERRQRFMAMDRVTGLASAGSVCWMKQQHFYVEKNATVQMIARIIVV